MKMIFAMLHSEDVDETVEELNKEKYWVTKLSTTGGFLKNKNVTLVIGTEDEQVPGALKILKECAGARQSVKYTMPSMSTGSLGPGANSMIPINMQVGGCTVFVVDVDQYAHFCGSTLAGPGARNPQSLPQTAVNPCCMPYR